CQVDFNLHENDQTYNSFKLFADLDTPINNSASSSIRTLPLPDTIRTSLKAAATIQTPPLPCSPNSSLTRRVGRFLAELDVWWMLEEGCDLKLMVQVQALVNFLELKGKQAFRPCAIPVSYDSLPDIVYFLVWILEDKNRATSSIAANVAINTLLCRLLLSRFSVWSDAKLVETLYDIYVKPDFSVRAEVLKLYSAIGFHVSLGLLLIAFNMVSEQSNNETLENNLGEAQIEIEPITVAAIEKLLQNLQKPPIYPTGVVSQLYALPSDQKMIHVPLVSDTWAHAPPSFHVTAQPVPFYAPSDVQPSNPFGHPHPHAPPMSSGQ
uniref:At1g04390 ARM repeat domain-containing protein n=1 Tax=Cucumis melo TaxID=3656 RepID=A0A9I9E4N9_CUCME